MPKKRTKRLTQENITTIHCLEQFPDAGHRNLNLGGASDAIQKLMLEGISFPVRAGSVVAGAYLTVVCFHKNIWPAEQERQASDFIDVVLASVERGRSSMFGYRSDGIFIGRSMIERLGAPIILDKGRNPAWDEYIGDEPTNDVFAQRIFEKFIRRELKVITQDGLRKLIRAQRCTALQHAIDTATMESKMKVSNLRKQLAAHDKFREYGLEHPLAIVDVLRSLRDGQLQQLEQPLRQFMEVYSKPPEEEGGPSEPNPLDLIKSKFVSPPVVKPGGVDGHVVGH